VETRNIRDIITSKLPPLAEPVREARSVHRRGERLAIPLARRRAGTPLRAALALVVLIITALVGVGLWVRGADHASDEGAAGASASDARSSQRADEGSPAPAGAGEAPEEAPAPVAAPPPRAAPAPVRVDAAEAPPHAAVTKTPARTGDVHHMGRLAEVTPRPASATHPGSAWVDGPPVDPTGEDARRLQLPARLSAFSFGEGFYCLLVGDERYFVNALQ